MVLGIRVLDFRVLGFRVRRLGNTKTLAQRRIVFEHLSFFGQTGKPEGLAVTRNTMQTIIG